MTEPDKINLRDAREEDVPAMAGLLSELFSLEKDFRPDLDKQMRGLRLLLKQPQLGRLFVASTDDGVVGMVSLLFTVSTAEGGPAAILEDMIVASAYRGQGIGRRLVEHVLDRAAKLGNTRVTLLADRHNQAALGFYRALGFADSNMQVIRKTL
jgi:ribosomal protein S18 acetylase RimI-like enzyme